MDTMWFYESNGQKVGPVPLADLQARLAGGNLKDNTLVWREGLAEWTPANALPELKAAQNPKLESTMRFPAPQPQPSGGDRGVLGGIGAKISELTDLPTISDVPVKQVFTTGLKRDPNSGPPEDAFVVGTASTTPALEQVPRGWAAPRVFWRILAGAFATYLLLRLGVTRFQNINFLPGMMVIGSFIVPAAVVVFFFEMNSPRNVSIYQVAKMVLFGGALSLVATVVLHEFIPGAGTGKIGPALTTGFIEELAKALCLVLAVKEARYRWQLNGLLIGAAVGAGFAGFESAGYALQALLGALGVANGSVNISGVFDTIMLRAVLAPGGHVIWTAMVGAAIWKAKGNAPFHWGVVTQPVVIRRFAVATILHGLWDADLNVVNVTILGIPLHLLVISVVGWYIILAMLKQSYAELDGARAPAPAAMPTPAS